MQCREIQSHLHSTGQPDFLCVLIMKPCTHGAAIMFFHVSRWKTFIGHVQLYMYTSLELSIELYYAIIRIKCLTVRLSSVRCRTLGFKRLETANIYNYVK